MLEMERREYLSLLYPPLRADNVRADNVVKRWRAARTYRCGRGNEQFEPALTALPAAP
jgi:hypothetical protein